MRRTLQLGQAETELILGRGAAQILAGEVASSYTKVVVISDENVHRLFSSELFAEHPWLTVPPGEESKSVTFLHALWQKMVDSGLDRRGAVVAVGGGVIGDLAGFAASTYLRGVDFYALPTSLLSMVDSSVGGKVGIDLCQGKNLVGQFYPARRVAVDPKFLDTLPETEWSWGMAEVVKHAILQGDPLWSALREFHPDDRESEARIDELLRLAVEVKVRIVERDPFEKTGLRATLNLGHTYGHALEWCSEFRLSHGAAVGLGMLAGLRLSRALGLLVEDFEPGLSGLLSRWNLPTSLKGGPEFSWSRVRRALGRDKKNRDGEWGFILPCSVGRVESVFGPPEEMVRAAIESLLY